MPEDRWIPPDLSGQVTLVTGASRGVGRGIVEVLAGCGAKTYLVARSRDSAPPGRFDTLAEVAEGIRDAGGEAAVAPCDLADETAIDALVERIGRDEGHLELLVNNAVGWEHEPEDGGDPGIASWMYELPWGAPRWWWESNFRVGVRSHWTLTNAAAPLFVRGRRGAVFFTSERQPEEPGAQELVLDLRATAVQRMASLFPSHLRPHRVSSILLYPRFTRTDVIGRAFEEGSDYFDGWTDDDFREQTASPHYVGRAVATLAADPDLLERTGTTISSYEAAVAYDSRTPMGADRTPRRNCPFDDLLGLDER